MGLLGRSIQQQAEAALPQVAAKVKGVTKLSARVEGSTVTLLGTRGTAAVQGTLFQGELPAPSDATGDRQREPAEGEAC